MPFIKGRYYLNPTMGAALEAAREAEAALLAQQGDTGDPSASNDDPGIAADSKGPIHHVEIEASEVVPAHSGRAVGGFVARVHRSAPQPSHAGTQGWPAMPPARAATPETHVFTDHRDLLNFLRDELAK
jgi:hypothetical protein